MDRPSWFLGAYVGDRDGLWQVTSTENRGRVLHWVHRVDGRKARTEVTPAHPAYPPDPTPEQARAENKAAAAARKRALRGY